MSLQAFQTLFYKLATNSAETATTLAEVPALSGLFSAIPQHQLQQYRWMVYANHAETLETIYPLTYALLEDICWRCHLNAKNAGKFRMRLRGAP